MENHHFKWENCLRPCSSLQTATNYERAIFILSVLTLHPFLNSVLQVEGTTNSLKCVEAQHGRSQGADNFHTSDSLEAPSKRSRRIPERMDEKMKKRLGFLPTRPGKLSQKTMKNHHLIAGKTHEFSTGPFSIANC